jgi:hypothetical protein
MMRTFTKLMSIGLLWLSFAGNLAQAQTVVTFQPDGTAGKDARVSSSAATTNYGTNPAFNSFRWSNGSWFTFRSFVEFDLTSIPSDATIIDSKLTLFGDGHYMITPGTNASYVKTVTSSWTESTVTWNTQPTLGSTVGTLAITSSPTQNDVVTVTTDVQAMVSDPSVNYGWGLVLQDEATAAYRSRRYGSSDNATAAKRPQLEVTYALPMELTVDVTHANYGTSDGSIDLTVNQGLAPFTYEWSNVEISQDISSLGHGAYTVKVTDALGQTATLIVVVLEYGNTVTIPIKFGADYVDDAVVGNHSTTINSNYGSIAVIQSLYWTAGSAYEGRSLLRIDVQGVPPEANLLSANLTLQGKYHNPATQSNAATLKLVSADWDEYTVTWNNQPPAAGTIPLALSTSSTQDYTLDLTTDYQSFFNGTPNYGYLLDGNVNTQWHRLRFHSSDAAASADWPELELVMSLPFPHVYANLVKKVDGGYHHPRYAKVYFLHQEKYEPGASASLHYTLYDDNQAIVGGVDGAGVVVVPGSPVHTVQHGKNWVQLDLSTLNLTDNDWYLLEVIGAHEDKLYLRFKYKSN